jgi:uncharacterized membrane protein (DUF485 family)
MQELEKRRSPVLYAICLVLIATLIITVVPWPGFLGTPSVSDRVTLGALTAIVFSVVLWRVIRVRQGRGTDFEKRFMKAGRWLPSRTAK